MNTWTLVDFQAWIVAAGAMITALTRSPGSPPSTTISTTAPSQSATATVIGGRMKSRDAVPQASSN